MEISYQCTFGDYKEAMDSQMRGPAVAYLLAIVGLFFLTWNIPIIVKNGFSGGAVLPLTGGLFLVLPLLLRIARKFWIEQDFRKHPGFPGKARMIVDDECLKIEGESERRETKWPAFTRYRETEHLFVLYEGARFLRIFPKRAFSGQELNEFRTLLASKIHYAALTSRASIYN